MAHSLNPSTAINGSPTGEVFSHGGNLLIIDGTYDDGHSYLVYIGDHRDSTDAVCYSGIPMQGNIAYPELNSVLRVYTPLLIGTGVNPYSVTVIDSATLGSQTLIDVLYVRQKQYYNRVYSFRKMLNPKYKAGPRLIEEEPT